MVFDLQKRGEGLLIRWSGAQTIYGSMLYDEMTEGPRSKGVHEQRGARSKGPRKTTIKIHRLLLMYMYVGVFSFQSDKRRRLDSGNRQLI
jgi:hypothetical protein